MEPIVDNNNHANVIDVENNHDDTDSEQKSLELSNQLQYSVKYHRTKYVINKVIAVIGFIIYVFGTSVMASSLLSVSFYGDRTAQQIVSYIAAGISILLAIITMISKVYDPNIAATNNKYAYIDYFNLEMQWMVVEKQNQEKLNLYVGEFMKLQTKWRDL